MLFNSLAFACFFPIVFLIYWIVLKDKTKIQNTFLLIASYFFYGCWDWRFLFLLATSTLLCFVGGYFIANEKVKSKRKIALFISVGVNILFLGFFKYFNFFIESFQELLQTFGFQANVHTLQIILPIGISFYTFHGLSYVIDIYYERIKPTTNIVNYSLFVSYFPLLVAGPIERATHLLPQLETKRIFDYSKMIDGLKQILWGLFKKIVIADNCASYVNHIFENPEYQTGTTSALAAILFAIQIYGDFSGYSDIALGVSRMLGIELLQNFYYPYFSRDIAEFWRRWHISLTTWFRDYLYIPLGGSRKGMPIMIRNIFIIFMVSGLWHGANWTFVAWGALHALYMMPSVIMKKNRKYTDTVSKGRNLPSWRDLANILATFGLATLAWILFRADSISQAYHFVYNMISNPTLIPYIDLEIIILLLFIVFMIVMEWINRDRVYGIANINFMKYRPIRWGFYYFLILAIIFLAPSNEVEFIYFQF